MRGYRLILVAPFLPGVVQAQGMRYPWEEYDKLIQRKTDMTALESGLLGDSVDMYSGSVGFSATDLSLPGTGIPIDVSRSMTPSNRADYYYDDLPMADWNLELPRLSGVFMGATGWASACTTINGLGAPPTVNVNGNNYRPTDYWQGNRLVIPGRGSQEMLVAEGNAVQRPTTGGPYPWLTADFTWFSCTPSRQNAVGRASWPTHPTACATPSTGRLASTSPAWPRATSSTRPTPTV